MSRFHGWRACSKNDLKTVTYGPVKNWASRKILTASRSREHMQRFTQTRAVACRMRSFTRRRSPLSSSKHGGTSKTLGMMRMTETFDGLRRSLHTSVTSSTVALLTDLNQLWVINPPSKIGLPNLVNVANVNTTQGRPRRSLWTVRGSHQDTWNQSSRQIKGEQKCIRKLFKFSRGKWFMHTEKNSITMADLGTDKSPGDINIITYGNRCIS